MQLSDNEISILLLCSDIGLVKGGVTALTQSEWGNFYNKLIENSLEPDLILKEDMASILASFGYDEEFIERVKKLADRSMKLSVGLEELSHDGINIMTIMDNNYPKLLLKKLQDKTPPVFYYVGDASHANKVGIGIVGSRNISDSGLEFTKNMARKAAAEKLVIYSGGARGVDTISEYEAMNNKGIAVEYIADSMYKKMKSPDAIRAIMDGRLLMLSDMNPRTGFIAWRAMNRNKYIYAASYGTFVVESDYNSGGTWSGAKEAIKKNLTRVYVRDDLSIKGNQEIIKLGGIPYKEDSGSLKELIMTPIPDKSGGGDSGAGDSDSDYKQLSLFD
ncbi:MAG: DNA-processing protein DprA [Eubacterium sp.]|nr:DNA-processing protein DprA [Eubacterium sp.]